MCVLLPLSFSCRWH